MLKYFKKYRINYIILDNLEIIEKQEFKENRYDEYLIKTYLKKIIVKISERNL